MPVLTVPQKLVSDVLVNQIDISASLPAGASFSSASGTVSVYSGVDASPASLLTGVSVSGTTLTFTLTGGLAGNVYLCKIGVVDSLGGTTNFTFYVAVAPDAV